MRLSARLAHLPSRPLWARLRPVAPWLGAAVAILALWQWIGMTTGIGKLILSSPQAIIADVMAMPATYGRHILATFRAAGSGFLLGTATAFVAAVLFSVMPWFERVMRGVNIAVYTMPAIVVAPLLVLFLKGDWPQIILAALMVYFPALSTMMLGLSRVDRRFADLVAIYGGSTMRLMRLVRLRGAPPDMLAGLRVAAPIAVLGAVLGEFGAGARFGLGSFLLSALPQANPARLWGIGLLTSGMALLGFLLFLLPAGYVQRRAVAATLTTGAISHPVQPMVERIAFGCVAAALPFAIWSLFLHLSGLNPIIAPPPSAVLAFLTSPAATPLWQALGHTLPLAGLGLLGGLMLAFVLAAMTIVTPRLARAFLPMAMILQNTPLVAMVPFVVLVFGRGIAASMVLAAVVVFFPAFVVLAQGFAAVPPAARDLVRTWGGGPLQELRLIAMPWSISAFFGAARLVAPQALMGVMVAEWLVSGLGTGNLLNISRGQLDYEMIWAGALVTILIAVALYETIGVIERKTRLGATP